MSELALTDVERAALLRGARAARSPQAYALRCRIVLACADGATNAEVAARLGVSLPTVGKWRSRFLTRRLAGLVDESRAGRPATIRPEQVARVVADTLGPAPEQAKRWSRASMAARSGVSASTIGRIWRGADLRPHLQDGLRLSHDPRFVARVVDVVGLYRGPSGRAVALGTAEGRRGHDEDRRAHDPAAAPGTDEARPTHGPGATLDGAGAGAGAAGPGRSRPAPPGRRTPAREYRAFLHALHAAVPADLDVHVVCDSAALHDSTPVRGWLAGRPRFHLHLIPAGPHWADQAERWFALVGGPPPHLVTGIGARPEQAEERADDAEPVVWVKSTEEIRHPPAGGRQ
ncbi:IS630 family transposase [Micromonospora sp. DT233]|uniref:IS630 family transposase n=1 Tax=Micromonospora sp. DT233 TaxID=3393432 RepID=UPI003CEB7956